MKLTVYFQHPTLFNISFLFRYKIKARLITILKSATEVSDKVTLIMSQRVIVTVFTAGGYYQQFNSLTMNYQFIINRLIH